MKKAQLWLKMSGLLGFLGVAMGAFGAHALADVMSDKYKAIYETASKYALIHAVLLACLAFAYDPKIRGMEWACRATFVGTCIFSGSLWILSIFEISWLGAITPIGGLTLLFAWGSLFFMSKDLQQKSHTSS